MFNDTELGTKNGGSATIGVKDWLLLDCIGFLNVIPLIGSIICIVLYIMIAIGSTTAPSMKNRIIASAIWLGISLALIVFLAVLVVAPALEASVTLG